MGRPPLREPRKGYHRPRTVPSEPVAFTLDWHDFETDGKHLWVTPHGSARIDRIKISRYLGDRSARRGYPTELIRPEIVTEDWARVAADFWLTWASTADAAAFPPVHLDHYIRQQERLQLLPS